MRTFHVEIEQETDGRWIAEVPEVPGVMAYGTSPAEALTNVDELTVRVLADRATNGEPLPADYDPDSGFAFRFGPRPL